MDFKNVPLKYRPIPFWSWNEKLDCNETKEQVRTMYNAGIGGFFMHARGGLQTEYMGKEWFDNVAVAKDEGKQLGMRPWAYDENGWPSGFGNGVVNGKGIIYQQKYLRMESSPTHTETAISKCGNHYFYYDVNPFYVDTLDKNVIKEFIESVYAPYYEKFGTEIEGFFTDEPQISRNGYPWSFVFEKEYKTRYGENILDCLEELFCEVGDYVNTRIKYWKMVTDLFSSAFMKQIYDWCDERGLKLTGHLVCEDNLLSQLASNGAAMPHYEYFHIPGMDWLGRNIHDVLTPLQVSSVAQQLGKEAVLSETFALCGHNVSFAELKGIYEWQMVKGINLLCPHLEGYSIRGMRKRDYPPAMYCQQPWWNEYGKLVDALSREGMLLTVGEAKANVLVIHPQTSAWAKYDSDKNNGIMELNDKFLKMLKELDRKHIIYHLGDETILERHGIVKNGKIIVGCQSYDTVITEACEYLLPSTERLIEEYKNSGGKILNVADIATNDICDNPEITYTKRTFKDFTLHYFVNISPNAKNASFKVCGKVLDIFSGETAPFDGTRTFEPWGSLMIIEDGSENIVSQEREITEIVPNGKFKVAESTLNAITLDKCDYYFNGELVEKNGYVLDITERANALEKKVLIHQEYTVNAEYIPETLYLLCETPEKFIIKINGKEILKKDCGYYLDKSFRKIDIAEYFCIGKNEITFDCEFEQSKTVYDNLQKAKSFESEKNKLVYDTEIEAIYLLGSFGIKTDGKWEKLEHGAVRYNGDFVISQMPEFVYVKELEKQGFPFFCGELELYGEIEINGNNPVLILNMSGCNAVKAECGNITNTLITGNCMSLENLSGKQKVKLTLINNLRNILGPHHLECGESYSVGPSSFFKEACVWNPHPEFQPWNEDYCFVTMGLI